EQAAVANPRKAKGTRHETEIVRYLREHGLSAFKPRAEGHADVGDIHVDGRWTLQAKAYANVADGVREGTDGARRQAQHSGLPFYAAVVKRPRKSTGDAYVVMPLSHFVDVARSVGAHATAENDDARTMDPSA